MEQLFSRIQPNLLLMAVLILLVLLTAGCASTVGVTETYVRPPEVDMSGKKTVVLESEGAYKRDAARVTSKLKQALISKQFTVADRDSMDAKAREQFFGNDQSATIQAATVLIRVNVLSSSTIQERNRQRRTEGKKENKRTFYVYNTEGKASTEVNFDVVDLGTTKILVSTTLGAERFARTSWDRENPGSIDTDSLLSKAYDDVVSDFMRKIAPYTVSVQHDVYDLNDEFPEAKRGIALLQAGMPDEAFEEFQAAFRSAENSPETDPENTAQLMHNMAVAREKSGRFEEALQLYIDSTRYEGAPDQSDNILRCRTRIQDQEKVK